MHMEVKHDTKTQDFYVKVGEQISSLRYKKTDEKTLEFYSTYVPAELRNRGIAAQLAKHALDYAEAQGYHVIASCSYVQSYIEHHPQYNQLLA